MQFQKTVCVSLRYTYISRIILWNLLVRWYNSAMKISSCQLKRNKNTTWRANPNHHGAPKVLRLGYGPASHTPKGHRTIPADLGSFDRDLVRKGSSIWSFDQQKSTGQMIKQIPAIRLISNNMKTTIGNNIYIWSLIFSVYLCQYAWRPCSHVTKFRQLAVGATRQGSK